MLKTAILLTSFVANPGSGLPSSVPQADTIHTRSGKLVGKTEQGVSTYLSVPYAAPPVGEFRFQAPQPVKPWTGVRDARLAGATAPQQVPGLGKLDMVPIVGDGWKPGSDYLTLNIWTPVAGVKRPVMVYIHGGGFTLGSKDAAVYNGTNFAKSGILCVAINYRLGIEGFLPIPGVPTNLAIRDMIAALKWVQLNIASFGGDPDNVTIFGESGGGMAVSALVVSPLTKGLFTKAVAQSGHGSAVYSKETGLKLVSALAKRLNVSPDRAGFQSVSSENFLKAQAKLSKLGAVDLKNENGLDPGFGVGRFMILYGDDVLPEQPLSLLKKGVASQVNLLMTTTAQEANIFFVPAKLQWVPGFVARWYLTKSVPKKTANELLKTYGLKQKGKSGGLVLTEALTDLAFRWPSRQFAAAHQGETHVLEFDWRSTACDGKLGAAHSVDLPLVFNTIEVVTGKNELLGLTPPKDLAKFTHALWVRFATDGTLPWPVFTPETRQVYQLSQKKAINEAILPAAAYVP